MKTKLIYVTLLGDIRNLKSTDKGCNIVELDFIEKSCPHTFFMRYVFLPSSLT